MSPANQQQQSRSIAANEHEATIQWLKDNYRECGWTSVGSSAIPGVPRASIYERYQQQYSQQRTAAQPPVNSATFGKLVRSVFTNIKTRRLGNRGQSKYYYCGIKEIDAPAQTAPASTESHDDQMIIDTDHEQITEPSTQQQHDTSIIDLIPPLTMSPSLQLNPQAEELVQRYRQHCNQILHLIDTHKNYISRHVY
ncbi:RFX DNA-binding domain-containing protein [Zychaea mexicana]|uniref:RFX DNA-binding domain-containing protein n=1 Tax=Zychaea mexicana TaxID=64656 RepID=UPI0022FECA18|nr:RFX DNA-binding domain-containing protein [Zychaea mexicana]KAI9494955.1 RFX DNA-binding domain-containing protein [Zychaea mexicana]